MLKINILIIYIIYINVIYNEILELILFTSDKCSSCDKNKIIMNELKKKLIKKITINEINCDKTELCAKYKVRSVPTIRLYNGSEYISFNNNETYFGLLNFIETYYNISLIKEKININEYESLMYLVYVKTEYDYRLDDVAKRIKKYYTNDKIIEFHEINYENTKDYITKNKINVPVILFFYHNIILMKFDANSLYDKIIVELNHIISEFPNKLTPSYIPTISISTLKRNSNLLESYNLLLMTFSEDCHHCRVFLPKWEQYSIQIRLKYPLIKLAKLNCKYDTKLCTQLEIHSVPTIILMKEGKIIEKVNNDFSLENLMSLLNSHFTPDDHEL